MLSRRSSRKSARSLPRGPTMSADGEPSYCGLCVGALDGDLCCDRCLVRWEGPLTEPEARVFQRAYGAAPLDEADDDLRWGNAWLAVERQRGGIPSAHS